MQDYQLCSRILICTQMKIAVLIQTLDMGGAERVGSLLMRHWSNDHEIIYLNYLPDSSSFFYELPETVDVVCLDLMKKSKGFTHFFFTVIRRIWAIHRTLMQKQPDILLCFLILFPQVISRSMLSKHFSTKRTFKGFLIGM